MGTCCAPYNDNMLAAGFDSGFVVFKLQSERPAMQINPEDGTFWYVKEQNLHHFSLQKGQPKDIISASLSVIRLQFSQLIFAAR